jgi:hypothetical protein
MRGDCRLHHPCFKIKSFSNFPGTRAPLKAIETSESFCFVIDGEIAKVPLCARRFQWLVHVRSLDSGQAWHPARPARKKMGRANCHNGATNPNFFRQSYCGQRATALVLLQKFKQMV